MKKISQIQWNRYKESNEGKKIIEMFQRLYSDEEVSSKYLLQVVKQINPEYFRNSSSKEIKQLEKVQHFYNDWLNEISNEIPENGYESIEDYEDIYIHILTELALTEDDKFETWDEIPQSRFKSLLGDNMLLSLALYSYIPEFYIPNLFVMQFIFLKQIAEKYEIELPEIPNRSDYKSRCLYYLEINEILRNFASENGITNPAEVCAFFYGYELDLAKEEINEKQTEIPEVAAQAWLLVGNMSEGEKDMNHGFWQANQLTNKGDILLFYEKSPVKKLNSVWIAQEDGVVDPFFHYYSNTYIGNRIDIPEDKAISFKEFKENEYFKNRDKEGNYVSKNFQDTSGWAVTRADYEEIKRMLEAKGFDTNVLPKLYEPQKRGEVIIENEADVSEKLLIPMLEEMGWREGIDFKREVHFNAGRTQTGKSSNKRPDFCLHIKEKNDDIEAKVVIEVKEFMKNEKEIHDNFVQGRSYAKWGNVKVLVICDLRQLRVYSVDNNHNFKETDFEKFSWEELEKDGDRFMFLKKLLS